MPAQGRCRCVHPLPAEWSGAGFASLGSLWEHLPQYCVWQIGSGSRLDSPLLVSSLVVESEVKCLWWLCLPLLGCQDLRWNVALCQLRDHNVSDYVDVVDGLGRSGVASSVLPPDKLCSTDSLALCSDEVALGRECQHHDRSSSSVLAFELEHTDLAQLGWQLHCSTQRWLSRVSLLLKM